jgi:hypothetical protein
MVSPANWKNQSCPAEPVRLSAAPVSSLTIAPVPTFSLLPPVRPVPLVMFVTRAA